MRVLLLAVALVLGLAPSGVATSEAPEQSVTAVTPGVEQQVAPVVPAAEQQVQVLDASGVQQVTAGTKNPARRGAETVGKVVLGVLAAGVSVGVMAAELLFL